MLFTCKVCGKEVQSFPSKPRQYCSHSCSAKAAYERRRAAGTQPVKPRVGEAFPCETCGKQIYRQKSLPNKRFCSNACRDLSNKIGTEEPCEGCGKPMWVVPSYRNKRFCGRECYEAQRTKKSGIGRQHNGREVIRDHSGYLRIWQPDHPAASQGRILEHRWVVEQEIGRVLATDEHVHHLNGVKDDNRLENLEIMDHSAHSRLTGIERRDHAISLEARVAEYERRFGPL